MKNLRKRLKYIFPVVILIMIAGLFFSRIFRPGASLPEPEIKIEAREAGNFVGTAAEVCGEVASARFLSQIDGKPTFINLGRPHPNQFFTVVIWERHRHKWNNPPEQMYLNREICVIGVIETHEGTPQIIVESPGQIRIQS